jgi:hypothetical protein
MTNSKEIKCIKMSRDIRLATARTHLVDIEKNGIPFEWINVFSVFAAIVQSISKEESNIKKIKQVSLIPVALLISLFLFILTPLGYLNHLWDVFQKKKSLKKKISMLSADLTSADIPVKKGLESLWQLEGLEQWTYSEKERLDLLCSWVNILYGKNLEKNLKLRHRVDEISEHQREANRPYFEGKNAPHFNFVAPIDYLISVLSKELPPYD